MADSKKSWRHPWVTYLIAVALVGGYIALQGRSSDAASAAAESVAVATGYFEANPYVELDPRFEALLGDRAAQARRGFQEDREARGLPPILGFERRRIQAEADELVANALARRTALPRARIGVSDRNSPSENLLAHVLVQDNLLALVLYVVLLICAGIALEGAWGSIAYGVFCLLAPPIVALRR